jgi:hypothetical protein
VVDPQPAENERQHLKRISYEGDEQAVPEEVTAA